ncbi:MAG TPA: GNAT family N-acetyltransferase [Chitinophagaceae bacterium]
MTIKIREGRENDFGGVLSLVKELAVFQGMPEKVLNTVEQMKEEREFFRSLVAVNENEEIVGIATYFFAYYTWVGKSLYLDDLYVKQDCRGHGIGSQLLETIVSIARDQNCKRVRWLVSEWNEDAIKFYEKCGVEIDREAFVCDLDQSAIIKGLHLNG